MAGLLAKKDDKKEVDLRHLAHRAFITYLRSIHKHRDKEVFDVMKLPIEEFSASLGLPMTPKIRFLNQKSKGKQVSGESSLQEENYSKENLFELPRESPVTSKLEEKEEDEEVDEDFLSAKETPHGGQGKSTDIADIEYVTFFLAVVEFCIVRIIQKKYRPLMWSGSCTSSVVPRLRVKCLAMEYI